MQYAILATFALIGASSLQAQTATSIPTPDFSYATPVGGNWSYAPTADGSQAIFSDASTIALASIYAFVS